MFVHVRECTLTYFNHLLQNYTVYNVLNVYRARYRVAKIIVPFKLRVTDNRTDNIMTFSLVSLPLLIALERKISVRASRDELVQKGILLPVIRSTSFPENGESLFFIHIFVVYYNLFYFSIFHSISVFCKFNCERIFLIQNILNR